MYVEIEVTMLDKNSNEMPTIIPRESISYYRGYISNEKEGKDKAFVMVYLKGNDRPMKIVSTLDAFKRKCCSKVLTIDDLSNEKVDKLREYVAELREK
jgi:hypothetical protein